MMKKLLAFMLTVVLCVCSLVSCSKGHSEASFSSKYALKEEEEHVEHTYEYACTEDTHQKIYTCGCPSPDIAETHIDADNNLRCDACGYEHSVNSTDIAQVVIDYENKIKDEIDQLHEKNPEYNFYYHPVNKILCSYILDDYTSADAIVEKYDMHNIFEKANVSALNSIKMIMIVFDRADFTEDMYQKVQQISDEDSQIEDLLVDMERSHSTSYMPKIDYYTNDAVQLNYTTTNSLINLFDSPNFIIRSKAEYDDYLNHLLETTEQHYLKEKIEGQKDLYDDLFFEENALILTKVITRGSGSIALTVNNLYISGKKVYVVVKTDVPLIGTDDMKYASFTFIVPKNEVGNIDEVITLE